MANLKNKINLFQLMERNSKLRKKLALREANIRQESNLLKHNPKKLKAENLISNKTNQYIRPENKKKRKRTE